MKYFFQRFSPSGGSPSGVRSYSQESSIPPHHASPYGAELIARLGGICSMGISASITALTIGAATVEP